MVGSPSGTLTLMPQGARIERVGEEFREILAEAIQRLKDPRVGFVTVTGVRVSADLHHARVYYTALGDEKARAGSRAALRSATPHLRRELGRQVVRRGPSAGDGRARRRDPFRARARTTGFR
jgi:ribosome-binding factor A